MSEIREGYTRITEIVAQFADFSSIRPEVLEKAAERGTRVHGFCELYVKRYLMLDMVDKEAAPYFFAFKEWFDEFVEEVAFSEKRLYCDSHMITGQIDLMARIRGDKSFSLLDIKTPQSAAPYWRLQTAAYQHLARANGHQCQRRIILQLPKSGSRLKVIEHTNEQKDYSDFLDALQKFREKESRTDLA